MRSIIFIFIIVFLTSLFSMNSCNSFEKNKERTVRTVKIEESKYYLDLVESPIEKDFHIYHSSSKMKYHYTLLISNAHREWESYETQEMINGEVRLKKTSPDISYLNGYYEWYSDIYLPDENAMFNYICDNYEIMKQYKVSQYYD